MRAIIDAGHRFLVDESGATMTEYGMLLLLIALVVLPLAKLLGLLVLSLYSVSKYL